MERSPQSLGGAPVYLYVEETQCSTKLLQPELELRGRSPTSSTVIAWAE